MMEHTEDFFFSLSFAEADTTSTVIEPKQRGDLFFPHGNPAFFVSFHETNYREKLEK